MIQKSEEVCCYCFLLYMYTEHMIPPNIFNDINNRLLLAASDLTFTLGLPWRDFNPDHIYLSAYKQHTVSRKNWFDVS